MMFKFFGFKGFKPEGLTYPLPGSKASAVKIFQGALVLVFLDFFA